MLQEPLECRGNLNGIQFHSNKANGVQKVVLALSLSVTGTWLYPLAKSIMENQQAPVSASSESSMRGRGSASLNSIQLTVVYTQA